MDNSLRACKHCGSPSRDNGPCWHTTDMTPKQYETFCRQGAERPCAFDRYEEEIYKEDKKRNWKITIVLIAVGVILIYLILT